MLFLDLLDRGLDLLNLSRLLGGESRDPENAADEIGSDAQHSLEGLAQHAQEPADGSWDAAVPKGVGDGAEEAARALIVGSVAAISGPSVLRAGTWRAEIGRAIILRAAVWRATVLRTKIWRAAILRAIILRAIILRAAVWRAAVLRTKIWRAAILRAGVLGDGCSNYRTCEDRADREGTHCIR
jgi:hypothetical protein